MNDEFSNLNDRELSPLSSNDIGDSKRSKSDMPNHHSYNKLSRAATTTTVTPTLTNERDGSPIAICNQKPYIPSKLFD
jgi:hypothetical protein